MNTGQCPNPDCRSMIHRVAIESIVIDSGGILPDRQFKGVSFVCKACGTVLGVSMDPLAVRNDIIDELKRTKRVIDEIKRKQRG